MALLECKELCKSFGGLVAVKNLHFKVESGEILGLIGPNGSGKTTVLNLISGVLKPDAGKILFAGKDIVGLRPHQICQLGIARTYQNVRPFLNHTVLQNVMVGALFGRRKGREQTITLAQSILDFVNLSDKKDMLVESLTLKDRKTVEIARALASQPSLLLLDEPMGGLSPTEVNTFLNLLKRIRDTGVTLIIVEHVMKALMSIAERVIVLYLGEKLVEGSPQEISNNKQVINIYLGEEYASTRN
ncbi:MAG: ABC transporter ATP-binding protein [Nitrososphaerales archaeon]